MSDYVGNAQDLADQIWMNRYNNSERVEDLEFARAVYQMLPTRTWIAARIRLLTQRIEYYRALPAAQLSQKRLTECVRAKQRMTEAEIHEVNDRLTQVK